MNLQQITREKHTYMLQTGDIRQELRKQEGFRDDQRVYFNHYN